MPITPVTSNNALKRECPTAVFGRFLPVLAQALIPFNVWKLLGYQAIHSSGCRSYNMNMNLSQLPPDLPRPVDNLALLKPLLKLRPFMACLAAIMQHKHYLHDKWN
jgi:hypothetical protein